MVRGRQVSYDASYREGGGVVRRDRTVYWRLARLERCSLALLVQEYLLTCTKVQILTIEALSLHISKSLWCRRGYLKRRTLSPGHSSALMVTPATSLLHQA